MSDSKSESLILVERIEKCIFLIRGEKVMLDRDLARLYGVQTYNLNKAVSRNRDRFPNDFMFRLSQEEFNHLRFQSDASSWGGSRHRPYVFTEQGVTMLSTVLRSKRAVQVNIEIMRTFVKLRQMLSSNRELATKLDQLEKKYDKQFAVVFEAIRRLMEPEQKPRRRIGF